MALSVTLHGFATFDGSQTAGRWATANILTTDGSDNLIYTVPVNMQYMILAISVTNRSGESVNNVGIAISQNPAPSGADFIEWNTTIIPFGTLERTQLMLSPGDKIFVRV